MDRVAGTKPTPFQLHVGFFLAKEKLAFLPGHCKDNPKPKGTESPTLLMRTPGRQKAKLLLAPESPMPAPWSTRLTSLTVEINKRSDKRRRAGQCTFLEPENQR